MKPYAIIREQPQLYNVYRVKVREQINPQTYINYIKNPKPHILQNFSSIQIHTIPKYYQQRKQRLPSYQRMYNSAGKYHRKPIFKVRDYTDLDLIGIQKQQQSINSSKNLPKIQNKAEKQHNIQNTDHKSQNLHIENQQTADKNIGRNNAINMNQQNKAQEIATKPPYKPIFNHPPQSYDLVQSILQNHSKQINQRQNQFINSQPNRATRFKSCQFHRHKPIFSKQNKIYEAQVLQSKTKVPFNLNTNENEKTSQKLKIYSHYGQINYQGQPNLEFKKVDQKQDTNSKLQQTIKKNPINKQIDQREDQSRISKEPKVIQEFEHYEYQQTPFCKTPPSKPTKQTNNVKESNIDIRSSNNSQKVNENNQSKVKQLLPHQQLNKELDETKVNIKAQPKDQQISPKKFKKVIGLKSLKKKSMLNNEPQTNQKVRPKIIKLKSKKSEKESKNSRMKSDYSSEQLKSQSECGSSVSIQIIKILNISPFYI